MALKNTFLLSIILLTMTACGQSKKESIKVKTSKAAKQLDKPNIIFLLADNMGYGELGSYGQDVK